MEMAVLAASAPIALVAIANQVQKSIAAPTSQAAGTRTGAISPSGNPIQEIQSPGPKTQGPKGHGIKTQGNKGESDAILATWTGRPATSMADQTVTTETATTETVMTERAPGLPATISPARMRPASAWAPRTVTPRTSPGHSAIVASGRALETNVRGAIVFSPTVASGILPSKTGAIGTALRYVSPARPEPPVASPRLSCKMIPGPTAELREPPFPLGFPGHE